MSERAKTIVKIVLLAMSVVAVVLLIIEAIDSAEGLRDYHWQLTRPDPEEQFFEFYQSGLNRCIQRLAAEILSIIALSCFNLYIWFFH